MLYFVLFVHCNLCLLSFLISGFIVYWKNKDNKRERKTQEFNMTFDDLEPETKYTVNVYVLRKSGRT